ncbi:G-protein coupled receptor 84 [Collichthys lucidus]|uniref:G-protein coupled receptor 84 n=1 Tax=Collichthys lucidus TaxID=240159 RepID=A0A4U5UB18_COLLU|nr:G-protein coupled receptor 84 [Collichthys lucidus]
MLMNSTNHTEDDVFSCYSPSVVGYRYFAVVWGCAVTITGTVGNLMTVLAFALDPRLRTRFNVLIVNLAAADLLYCTILQPISVDSYLHPRWRTGQLWCSIFGLLLFLSHFVSIITLCLVAVGRYLLVAKRAVFERVFSDRGLIILLISAWALGLGSFAPLHSVYVFVPQMCTCSFHPTKGRQRVRIISQALLRYRFSRRSSRKKPASSAQGPDDSGVNTCSCEISSQADLTQNTDEITCEESPRSTQGSPKVSDLTTANDMVPTPAPTSEPSSHSAASGDDKEMKHVTSICINPVVYAVMSKSFQQAYHVLLTRAAAPFTGLRTRWSTRST